MTDRVRIHDVAAVAGVSTTTVSHALSGRGKVSPGTRDRVRRVASDLGYAPNRIATALRRRRTGVIGFVSDEIATTPFAGRIVLGAQDAAAEIGLTLMVVNSNRDLEVERRQVDVLKSQQVDALLMAAMFHRSVRVPAGATGLPVVLVNGVDESGERPSIVPDEHLAAYSATRLLLTAGHRRVTHVTLDAPGIGVDRRLAGYTAAMAGWGLPTHVVRVPQPADARSGRVSFERALGERPDLTAVFCFNDPMAMGVYQGAAERGLRIPEDVSIVGVDNLEIIADQLRPGLTTMALPHYEMGRWAVQEAARRVDEGSSPAQHVQLPCPMVVRESVTGPVSV
ncbi:LacI family DNA-binding transcriptional regulator [uncultured Amnibacterium sp.]|uniref:LacI family DNA-binding transcriptional regulator n=1 Tax=uncultured Amnibacterium sp. TaxID=1631851 RepID=UPI0035CC8C04